MRIQELEQKTGLERPTIRFYEREGLVNPKRTENGYREYSEEDATQLLKIKLLRQLGMSVEKIRKLQQGSADFAQAMEEQIAFLSSQIQEQKRAREICLTIRTDGVDYQSMDAAHYLKLLRELPSEDRLPLKRDFQENIPREIHPWRRYFARTIDLLLFSLLMDFVLFVVFRLRPFPGDFLRVLMGLGYGFLYVPTEAWLLHRFGTTPGKWAMGIRLEWIEGGNLPYTEALYRSWWVLKYGMAFGIPIVQLGFQIRCYCALTGTSTKKWVKYNDRIDPPAEMDWDTDTEIIYSDWEGKVRWRILPLIFVYGLLLTVTVCDCFKPAYRSSELTVFQFAKNYNSTARMLDNDGYYMVMEPDGTLSQEADTYLAGAFAIGAEAKYDNRRDFQYETEDGILRAMTWENTWEDVWYLHPLASETLFYEAAVTALLSQPDCGLLELLEFAKLWDSHIGKNDAEFVYQNIEISWHIECENAENWDGIFHRQDENAESAVSLQFALKILSE